MFDVLKCASASIPALTAPNLHFVRNYNPFEIQQVSLTDDDIYFVFLKFINSGSVQSHSQFLAIFNAHLADISCFSHRPSSVIFVFKNSNS